MSETIYETVLAAIERACSFLVAGQERDGFWRDYYMLLPGPSSDWVTAFVGYALLSASSSFTHTESLSNALSAMRSSCRPSGWGYNAAVATDADTTSWAVRYFTRAKAELPIESIACLEAYIAPGGGVRTFVCDPRYGSWTMEHVDVTAILGLAMKEVGASSSVLDRLRQWLLGQRNGDGLWTSFWWTFDAYATARILEFLSIMGGIPRDVAEASLLYIERRKGFTNVMETANLLIIASLVGACPNAWISSLLSQQRLDGGWPPSRVLKIPNQKPVSEDEAAFEDLNGMMSTAMAIMAFTEFLGWSRSCA